MKVSIVIDDVAIGTVEVPDSNFMADLIAATAVDKPAHVDQKPTQYFLNNLISGWRSRIRMWKASQRMASIQKTFDDAYAKIKQEETASARAFLDQMAVVSHAKE